MQEKETKEASRALGGKECGAATGHLAPTTFVLSNHVCSLESKDPALPMLGLVARETDIPNPVSKLLCLPPNTRGMVLRYQDFCKQE